MAVERRGSGGWDELLPTGGDVAPGAEWPDGEQVATRMRRLMLAAFDRVLETSERLDVGWRTAALSVAIERVAEASRMRSVYP